MVHAAFAGTELEQAVPGPAVALYLKSAALAPLIVGGTSIATAEAVLFVTVK
jgi:hypothetical protein